MKKLTVLMLIMTLSLSASACGKKTDSASVENEVEASDVLTTEENNESSESDEAENMEETEEAEPEETEPEEAATESDTSAATYPSDDLFAFEVSVDGELISVPCKVSDLETLGYSFGDKSENVLETNYTTGGLIKNSNGNSVSVGIFNDSGSEKTFAECDVDDIYFYQRSSEGQSIVFAKGITFGATQEDIVSAFGEPSRISDVGDLITLDYYKDGTDKFNSVSFNVYKGALNEVDLLTR